MEESTCHEMVIHLSQRFSSMLCFVVVVVVVVFFTLFHYNSFHVYCRELAPGTVSLTGDRAQGDDSKHYSHYSSKYDFHVDTEKMIVKTREM